MVDICKAIIRAEEARKLTASQETLIARAKIILQALAKVGVVALIDEATGYQTDFVERANLSIRMQNRRFTRLTNAFSKKFQNHVHALALYFAFYNFVRVHKTLRMTPAMAAGITDTLWTMEDIVAAIDARAEAPKKRGPYKKRAA